MSQEDSQCHATTLQYEMYLPHCIDCIINVLSYLSIYHDNSLPLHSHKQMNTNRHHKMSHFSANVITMSYEPKQYCADIFFQTKLPSVKDPCDRIIYDCRVGIVQLQGVYFCAVCHQSDFIIYSWHYY